MIALFAFSSALTTTSAFSKLGRNSANASVRLSARTFVPFNYIVPSLVTATVAFCCSIAVPLLTSGIVMALSID